MKAALFWCFVCAIILLAALFTSSGAKTLWLAVCLLTIVTGLIINIFSTKPVDKEKR